MKIFQWTRQKGYWIVQRGLYLLRPCKKNAAREVDIIYKPDAIGDFLLASGMIRELTRDNNHNWILLCSPETRSLVAFYFPDLEVRVIHGSNSRNLLDGIKKVCSTWSFCRSIRIKQLVCLKNARSGMDHVLLNWLNPQNSYGLTASPIHPNCPASFKRFSFSHSLPYPGERDAYPLEIYAHQALLEAFTSRKVEIEKIAPYLDLPKKSPVEKTLVLFPVTRSPLRNYPLEKLAECVRRFSEMHPRFRFILSGTQSEKKQLESFRELLPADLDCEISLPASILDAAKLIQSAFVTLSMDSAPAHLAICLDRPGVFLLAGGQYNHFAPWGNPEIHKWLTNQKPCFGCNWNCIYSQAVCLVDIPPNTIIHALDSLAQ